MKARVKATGEIVTARGIYTRTWTPYLMEEIDPYDMNEVEVITDPDYWERLKHQYAGMAMQGILSNEDYCKVILDEINEGRFADNIARAATDFATALVEKLKEEK